MKTQDFNNAVFLSMPIFIAASKRPAFRAHYLKIGHATVQVFCAGGLTKEDLRQAFDESPETFVMKFGDLTPEGFAFAKAHFHRWLRNITRWSADGGEDKYIATLQTQLQRFRESQNAS